MTTKTTMKISDRACTTAMSNCPPAPSAAGLPEGRTALKTAGISVIIAYFPAFLFPLILPYGAAVRLVVFGASGMVGQGAVRACLRDEGVSEVLLVVRRPLHVQHAKVREIVHTDFTDYTGLSSELTGLDGCLFCLGMPSAGCPEEEYIRVTHDYTLAAARALTAASPAGAFVYISGHGADSTERSRFLGARVKGSTENALLALPGSTYVFRPAYIQPEDGAVSRTPLYRRLYRVTSGLYPLLQRIAPRYVTTTGQLGRAMIAAVRLRPAGPAVLHTREINQLAAASPSPGVR
ncbi:epimerase [Streptomyces sp. NPDC008121]|uniref:epimerase n=1 Tax=Streptomyces sp. NPDC008121 TaxID=3364809 RepID=UPI0036E2A08F